jgi:hypothetical protein
MVAGLLVYKNFVVFIFLKVITKPGGINSQKFNILNAVFVETSALAPVTPKGVQS